MTSRSRRARSCAGVLFLCALALEREASAQTRKLSAPLPRVGGQVVEHWTTRNGAWCVFLANPERQAQALYSVSFARGQKPIELSRSVAGSITGAGVRLAEDGTRVDFSVDGELYTARIDGSDGPVLLAGPAVTGQYVDDDEHEISSDGSRAVFAARPERFQPSPFQLCSVALDGPASPVLLATPPSGVGSLASFAISPAGQRVVYTAAQDAPGVLELYSVRIDGSAGAAKLNAVLPRNGDVATFRLTADGTRVVYLADQERDEFFELFVVPSDGSAGPVKLNGALGAGRDVLVDFALLPTGRVVYRADQLVNEVFELFSVPLDGSAPSVRLNGPLVSGGDVMSFRATPDMTSVVYAADQDTNDALALHLAPVDGSAPPFRLDGPPLFPNHGDERDFQLSADGGRVVYRARDSQGVIHIHAVPLTAGAAAVQLTPGHTSWFDLSPDGARVVYRTLPAWPESSELASVPIDGSTAPVLLGQMDIDQFESGTGFSITPDSSAVLFRARRDKFAVELYRVPIDASAAPVRVSMSLLPGPVVGDAWHVGLGAGGKRAVYQVMSYNLPYFVPSELWSAPLGVQPPLPLFIDREHEGLNATLDPSGRWVVFLTYASEGTIIELWCVPVDGSTPAVRLSEFAGSNVDSYSMPAVGDRLVFGTRSEVFAVGFDGSNRRSLTGVIGNGLSLAHVEVEPGGTRALYRVYDFGRRAYDLYCVPTAGSSAPRKVNGGLASCSVSGFTISRGGARVVYVADQDADDVFELYSAPLDGSGGSVKLSPPLVTRGDVSSSFLLSPDGARVVFLADAIVDGVTALYSAPLDGSAAAVVLEPDAHPGLESSLDLRITPDSARVTYLADPGDDGSVDLFSVAIRGGPARRLNAPLVAGGSVEVGYQLGPTGRTVVYRADQDADDVFELYSVPCDGRRAPVKLSAAPRPQTDVEGAFAITPDERQVVFAADARVDEVVELFAVPIRGGAPQPLHPPFPRDADVQVYEPTNLLLSPDSRRVLYVADAETDEVFELFESLLPRPISGRVLGK